MTDLNLPYTLTFTVTLELTKEFANFSDALSVMHDIDSGDPVDIEDFDVSDRCYSHIELKPKN